MFEDAKHITQYARRAVTVIVLIFTMAVIGFFMVGRVYSDIQFRILLEAMMPSIRTLCFAVITASATIIPLLMTMTSLARRTDNEFDPGYYKRLRIITLLGTVALVLATLLLLVISIPITETQGLSRWYGVVYLVVVIGASGIASLLVGIIVTLYQTMSGLIAMLTPQFSDE